MRPATRFLFPAVCVVLLAAPAFADDVIMADGRTRHADILKVLDDGIRVRVTPNSGGTAELTLPASSLDPYFYYGLRDKQAGDDAKSRLRLALWAVEAGLFSRAKLQIEKASELDPQLVKDIREGKLPEIREGIARHVLDSSKKDIERERYDLAEKKLEALLARMPDTEAGTEARDVYQDLEAKIEDQDAKLEQEKLDRLDEEQKRKEEELRRKVDPIKKLLMQAKDLLEKGLVEDSEADSLKYLKQAIDMAKQGLRKVDEVVKDFPDDDDLAKRAEKAKEKVIAGMVKAYVHRADIYTWRGSVKQAREELDEARKIAPDDPSIEAAAESAAERESAGDLDVYWQRNRRAGMRFRSGTLARGGRGGGGGRGGR